MTYRYSTRLCFFLVVCLVLVAAPSFSQAQCRWNEGHFPQAPVGDVRAMAVYDDRSGPALYVGGSFGHLARWDGEEWTEIPLTTGYGHFGVILAMKVFDDGTGPALYVGGWFQKIHGVEAHNIARWDGANWSPLIGRTGEGVDHWVGALEAYDDGFGPVLVVAGHFSWAGGDRVNHIARWDGRTWKGFFGPRRSGVDGDVFALETLNDGDGQQLFAGGWFVRAGGERAFGVARWNGKEWRRTGDSDQPGLLYTVRGFSTFDHDGLKGIIAYGPFFRPDPIRWLDPVYWAGDGWVMVDEGQASHGDYLADAVFEDDHGVACFFGGRHSVGDAGEAHLISRWSQASGWSSVVGTQVPDQMSGWIRAMTVFDDGSGPALYVGGDFELFGNQYSENLARFSCHPPKGERNE